MICPVAISFFATLTAYHFGASDFFDVWLQPWWFVYLFEQISVPKLSHPFTKLNAFHVSFQVSIFFVYFDSNENCTTIKVHCFCSFVSTNFIFKFASPFSWTFLTFHLRVSRIFHSLSTYPKTTCPWKPLWFVFSFGPNFISKFCLLFVMCVFLEMFSFFFF